MQNKTQSRGNPATSKEQFTLHVNAVLAKHSKGPMSAKDIDANYRFYRNHYGDQNAEEVMELEKIGSRMSFAFVG